MQKMVTYVGCKEKGQELKKQERRWGNPEFGLAWPGSSLGAENVAANFSFAPAPHQHLLSMSAADSSSSSSSVSDGQAETWDDWTEEPVEAKSLFDDSTHPSPQQALQYDKQTHGVDLLLLASTLGTLYFVQLGLRSAFELISTMPLREIHRLL